MCTQKPPHDYSQQLYEKYKEAFEEYINSTVRAVGYKILSLLKNPYAAHKVEVLLMIQVCQLNFINLLCR